ncbi:MAG: diadenosine tetraphosphatase [Thiothrix sp.]|nr:MAG: diadenosine tetraphosphatase [Thiothrix sp.]
MSIYAIGDIQGCYDELQRLLDHLNFTPDKDHLWFTGDLVNRGPKSLATLRLVKSLDDHAVTVLGNHDLHLLAVSEGLQTLRKKDTLDKILDAPDAAELLHWLRHRPILHYDEALNTMMVHAGLPPQWTLKRAQKCARKVEKKLRGPKHLNFLAKMYDNKPDKWSKELSGMDRLRFITNAFTRLRYCTPDGRMNFDQKMAPGSQPDLLLPWFQVPGRRSISTKIIFGHWSTAGYRIENNTIAIDTGCIWGGSLTAVCLDSPHFHSTNISCK